VQVIKWSGPDEEQENEMTVIEGLLAGWKQIGNEGGKLCLCACQLFSFWMKTFHPAVTVYQYGTFNILNLNMNFLAIMKMGHSFSLPY